MQFIEINAFTARLLTLLEPGKLSGHAALEQVADESCHPDRALLVQAGRALLNDLRAQGAIFGRALD